ncbi:IS200/IS605 family element RNA-guided endonuclease TnpB [Eubacterium ruminantium]|uniref:Putative transposase n=3 Tax=Eubacterium ruminantium TaxID=42322 RepID=A0A1T4QPB7_9FIRM|nr:IS200/IS605 family element RNA-guided endonuclease TnpB [Eubacterium ruminantium]SKA05535.1 putative transposase [Eubacterium ruminantium]
MEKAYKYRIYPNKTQQELIHKTFGCVRFVYNYYLDKRIKAYQENKTSLNYYDCCKDLTSLKKELEWLREPDKDSLQKSLKDLDEAYKKFFKEHSGFPRFKSKKNHKKSYRTSCTNNNIEFQNNHIKLPKLGWVKTRDTQISQGRILNATISQDPSGKYYCSLCCTDIEIKHLPPTNNQVGIDLGIKDFAITSDGVKYSNPKYLQQSLNKLAKLQRELSRKTRGGSNWNKTRIKVARQYEKIRNQRHDFLQKLSTELIKENDIICIEDLNISEMIQDNRKDMRRNIGDVSWCEFTRQLQYKADWYGRIIIKVGRYFASSQICSCCGNKFPITKDLGVRQWICPNCKSILDRDINAAINILNEGLKQIA